jgi:mono/diheme cytochrome c family protein
MTEAMAAKRKTGLRGVVAAGFAVVVMVAAGCRSTPPPTPLAQLNAQQAHGHVVFETQCGACHYDRVDRPLHGPAMAGLYKRPALPSGAPANDERVTAVIEHGRNMMPAIAVAPGDLNDLLAYLHTI